MEMLAKSIVLLIYRLKIGRTKNLFVGVHILRAFRALFCQPVMSYCILEQSRDHKTRDALLRTSVMRLIKQ